MSYLDWKVGDKVVCVNASPMVPGTLGMPPEGLVVGAIYTVRWVGPFKWEKPFGELISVRLVEYVRDGDDPVAASRFRPVQTRKTDISCFQRLLTDPNIRIEEDA